MTLAGLGGVGQGLIRLTGYSATLSVKGNATLDNALVDIGGGNTATLVNYGTLPAGSTLTLGANLSIVQTGAYASITGTGGAGDNVLNAGTITAALAGGIFTITPVKFTNTGVLIAGNGETLDLRGAGLTNIVGATLTGGAYQAGSGGFIELADNTLITTLQADVTETGASAAVRALNTGTNTQRGLDATLTTIGSAGALRLLGGRSMTTAGAFSVGGVLQLGGGTFTPSALTETATGTIVGNGVVASAIIDAGVIEAKGGVLKLSGAVTGAGHLQIDTGATLELGAAAVDQEGVAFAGSNGVLLLDTPASFTGVISAFGATETIDLAHTLATGATLNGTTMTVNLVGGGTQTYALAKALPGMLLKTSSDGNGGTLVQDLYPENFATASVTPTAAAGNSATAIDFGHQHVGAVLSEALVVANTAVAPAEGLDAIVGGVAGAATASGSVSLLAAGGVDSTHLTAGLDSSVAGVRAGTATIALGSDGTGPGGGNGLGVTPLQSQAITVKGVLYRYAAGAASPLPSNVIVHVGDILNETITVANTAVADGYSEGLDVSVLGASPGLTAQGAVTHLAAGGSDSNSLTVGVSTAASGVVAGSVQLGLTSDGAGVSNLANTNEGSTTVAVGATVDNYALAAFASAMGGTLTLTGPNTYTLDLGQMLRGSAPVTATFAVANAATGLADRLAGAFVNGGDSALSVGGLGAFSGLGAGQSDTALSVTLSAANAGTFHDTLVLKSAGSNASGYSQALADVTLNIVGSVVYPDAFASGTITPLGQNTTATSVDFGNQRLGTTIAAGVWVQNTAPMPGEVLDAIVVSASGDATGLGAVNGLAAGASDTVDLKAALDATKVGVHSGTVTFGLISDGPASPGGGNGVGLTPVGGKTIAVTGSFYREAVAAIAPLPSNVIVHVGDKLNEAVSITNAAAADGWSEKLDVVVINTSGGASASGGVSLLAAGATDPSSLSVGLSTANAGMISGSVLLAPESDGAGTSGFTATSLGGINLAVAAQVDNYAQAAFKAGTGGALSQTGANSYTLDLGSVAQGAAALSATFGAGNSASVLSDLLAGSFVNSGSGALTVSGLGAFSGLGADQTDTALKVSLSTLNAGVFSDTLTLTHLVGSNASGFSQALADVTLTITGKVLSPGQATINTPQPLNLGNHHVGDLVAPVALSVTNSAPATSTSLSLDASLGALPFAVMGAGTIAMLAPGATDASSLTLGVSTLTSGAIAGAATINFASYNGSTQTPLAGQSLAVKGGVYAYATPVLPASLDLGATRVGKKVTSSVALANGAFANLFQEGLDYSVGAAPSGFTLGGASSGVISSGKSAPIGVTLAAATAGVFAGSVSLGLTSDGIAANGLALTPLVGQAVSFTGKVYAPAVAQLGSTVVNFGSIHVGGLASQSLQITNIGSGSLVDSLTSGPTTVADPNYVFGTTGSLGAAGLAAGMAGALGFTFSSSQAGQFSATAALSLSSHDSDLADIKVAAPTVTLAAKAYALANPILNSSTTLTFGAVRVGGAVNGLVVSLADGAAANAFQERLAYSVGALPTGYLLGGGASGVVLTGTPKSLTFGLNTSVAGDYTNRTVALSLTSTGAGTSGLADTVLAPVTITLSGKVYKAATVKLGATTLAFGVVHVGDVVSAKSLAVTNTAVGALTDTLVGGFGAVSGPFSGTGSLGAGLASGAIGSLGVTLNTAASGVFSGTAALALASHDADLADVSVTTAPVTLTATVDTYAAAGLIQVAGAGQLTAQGGGYVLNLGTIAQNGGSLTTQIEAMNTAAGLSDLLSGVFTKTGSIAFTNTALSSFSGLAAGKATGPITISLASTASGAFSEVITLSATGSNASGYKGALTPETLTITGTVLAPKGSYSLTAGKDTIAAANNNDTITGAANTLTTTDSIDGGAGVNTLALVGGGQFDLRAPTKLTNIQLLNAQDGQYTSSPATNHQQVVWLRDGLDLTVNVAPDLNANPGLIVFDSIVIHGAANNDVINLSSGIDTVYLGGAGESVVGGGGLGTVISTAAFAGALVQGGGHGVTLEITDGGAASLNAADANLTVQLDKATTLAIHGGAGVTIGGDASVRNTLVGATASLDQLSVQNFATGNETLDLTDLGFGVGTTVGFTANAGGTGGVLSLGDGVHSAAVTLFGQFLAADFNAVSDGGGGTMIAYAPPLPGGAMAMATPVGH